MYGEILKLPRPNRYVSNNNNNKINIDQTGTRALIKHGEIREDSIAAPQKVVYQPFAKNQN